MSPGLLAGFRLGGYEIRSRLGAGGMGEVYLARDIKLNRDVALKILASSVATDPQRMKRFVQEAKATSALNHPNILTVYQIDEVDGTTFIATEFVDGETLRQCLRRNKMELGLVLDVAIQIAAALSVAHQAGIVHRDIKPENIMLRRDGIIKVLDFGLAKLIVESAAAADTQAQTKTLLKTDPGTVVGTAVYMSPEQARGVEVDTRTDIFSLGVVLYEMVTGCSPFARSTSNEVIASLLSDIEPSPLARYSRDVPVELERIVSKAMRKNREERYQTVKDLLLDLQGLKQELQFERRLERSLPPTSKNQKSGENHDETVTQSAVRTGVIGRAIELNKKGFVITIGALLLVGLAAGAYYHFARVPGESINSIAVLPLVNRSGDPNMEYLTDGIAESLMDSLSQMPNLKVTSRNTAFRYKAKDQDAASIGKELTVRAVLTGSLKQIGDRVVINVSLDDALDNHQIWGSQYDRKASDLLLVQQEIVRDISGNLRLKLSSADENRLNKRYTESPEAYQLYLKGLFYLNKRTGEGGKKALEYFEQAIEKDPNYALGYVGLADTYYLLSNFSDSPPKDVFPKAKAAATRAIELDEGLAEAHASLASALVGYDRNFPEAGREFRRAIELNPNNAPAHHRYGILYLAKVDRFDEAIAELKRAQDLDPLSLIINSDLGNTYIHAHQYDKAIEQLRRTIDMDPNFYFAHWQLGIAYEATGALNEATLEYQKARQLNDDPWVLALLAHVYATSGKRNAALKTLDELNTISKRRYVSAYSFAIVYAALGEKDSAFQSLEKSLEDREPRIIRIKIDPLLTNLHTDPRFDELLQRIGLSH